MSKKIPWEKIKKRYLAGEKPGDIAGDYGLTSKQVRDKAYREEWGAVKATILDEIATEVRQQAKSELTDTHTLLGTIYGQMLKNINSELPNISARPSAFNTHPDKYHLIALREGIKHYHRLELLAARNKPPDDPEGNNSASLKDVSEMSDSELDRLIKDS